MLIPPNPRERRNHLVPMRFAPSIGLIDGSCGVSELLRTCTLTFRRNGHCRMSRANRTHWKIEEVDHHSRRSTHATFLSRPLTHAIVYLEIILPLRVQLILSASTEQFEPLYLFRHCSRTSSMCDPKFFTRPRLCGSGAIAWRNVT